MRRFLMVILLCFGLSACVSTPDVQWRVETQPPGAKVSLSTGQSCQSTPCSFLISTGESFDVTIEKAGFVTVRERMVRRVTGGQVAGVTALILLSAMAGGAGTPDVDVDRLIVPNPLRIELLPVDQESIADDGDE